MYERVLRKLLFKLEPERTHGLAMWLIRRGLVRSKSIQDGRLRQDLLGATFPNPLGLAAGFDKDATALARWHALGFGFVEVGTVTARPQPGNPPPRVFRLPADRALVNRLGFNSEGAQRVARRLSGSRPNIPYGVNIGKSRAADSEEAAADYLESFGALGGFGAYTAINVSSPNTPGLRMLHERSRLADLLAALKAAPGGAEARLMLKVSPDLSPSQLDDVVMVAHEQQIAGLIATNTTTARDGLSSSAPAEGGLSGAPLKARSDEVLRGLYRSCDEQMVLIGVGGVFSGRDLYDKLAAGAHLAQIYTGFVYLGPGAGALILGELLSLLGDRRVSDVRGCNA